MIESIRPITAHECSYIYFGTNLNWYVLALVPCGHRQRGLSFQVRLMHGSVSREGLIKDRRTNLFKCSNVKCQVSSARAFDQFDAKCLSPKKLYSNDGQKLSVSQSHIHITRITCTYNQSLAHCKGCFDETLCRDPQKVVPSLLASPRSFRTYKDLGQRRLLGRLFRSSQSA